MSRCVAYFVADAVIQWIVHDNVDYYDNVTNLHLCRVPSVVAIENVHKLCSSYSNLCHSSRSYASDAIYLYGWQFSAFFPLFRYHLLRERVTAVFCSRSYDSEWHQQNSETKRMAHMHSVRQCTQSVIVCLADCVQFAINPILPLIFCASTTHHARTIFFSSIQNRDFSCATFRHRIFNTFAQIRRVNDTIYIGRWHDEMKRLCARRALNDLKENWAKLQSTFAVKHNFSIWCCFQMHYSHIRNKKKRKRYTHTASHLTHNNPLTAISSQKNFCFRTLWSFRSAWRYVIHLRFVQIQTMPISYFISNCLLLLQTHAYTQFSSMVFDTLHAIFVHGECAEIVSEGKNCEKKRNPLEKQYRNNCRLYWNWKWPLRNPTHVNVL